MVIYAGTQGAIMIDIAAIKARADKAIGAFITCVAGDGKPYVKFQFRELKAAQDFHGAVIDGSTDIPALIAALEASETARVKAEQEVEVRLSEIQAQADFIEKVQGEREQWKASDATRVSSITALEQERDALKKALTAVRDDLQVRAVKNVVAVGVSVWIEVNTALESKP